jgi:hypothetical protein
MEQSPWEANGLLNIQQNVVFCGTRSFISVFKSAHICNVYNIGKVTMSLCLSKDEERKWNLNSRYTRT